MLKAIRFLYWFNSIFAIASLSTLVLPACQKDPRPEAIEAIDPETEADRLCRSLLIENGTNLDGTMPEGQYNALRRIVNYQSSAAVSFGATLPVPFTITTNEPIKSVYLTVAGADNYWSVPASASLSGGTVVLIVGIPSHVKPGKFSLEYTLETEYGNVFQGVVTTVVVEVVNEVCAGGGSFSKSGSAGLSVFILKMGGEARTVDIHFNTYTVPDRLDIRYNGKWVASTNNQTLPSGAYPPPSECYDNTPGYVGATGILKVDFDPTLSDEIEIFMFGCFNGGTAWDIWLDCGSGTADPECPTRTPQQIATPKTVTVSAKTGEATNDKNGNPLFVNKGDFVCVVASGVIVVRPPDDDPYYNNPDYSNSVCTSEGLANYPFEKKYPDYNFGQLIVKVGNQVVAGLAGATLGDAECPNVPDETFQYFTFLKEKVAYFISPADGLLKLEINDNDPSDNVGAFGAEIYTLTPVEHTKRNCFNQCPKLVKQSFSGTDSKGSAWEENETSYANLIGYPVDEYIEDCFHCGFDDLRGKSSEVRGCQCVYDFSKEGDSTNLVNSPSPNNCLGSFDYGYVFDPADRRLHYILDVYPHVAFLRSGSNAWYASTPEKNLYK